LRLEKPVFFLATKAFSTALNKSPYFCSIKFSQSLSAKADFKKVLHQKIWI